MWSIAMHDLLLWESLLYLWVQQRKSAKRKCVQKCFLDMCVFVFGVHFLTSDTFFHTPFSAVKHSKGWTVSSWRSGLGSGSGLYPHFALCWPKICRIGGTVQIPHWCVVARVCMYSSDVMYSFIVNPKVMPASSKQVNIPHTEPWTPCCLQETPALQWAYRALQYKGAQTHTHIQTMNTLISSSDTVLQQALNADEGPAAVI